MYLLLLVAEIALEFTSCLACWIFQTIVIYDHALGLRTFKSEEGRQESILYIDFKTS